MGMLKIDLSVLKTHQPLFFEASNSKERVINIKGPSGNFSIFITCIGRRRSMRFPSIGKIAICPCRVAHEKAKSTQEEGSFQGPIDEGQEYENTTFPNFPR